jgi:putative membrane protein
MDMTKHAIHTHGMVMDNLSSLLLAMPFICLLILYISAVILSNRHYKTWPAHRIICWVAGIVTVMIAFASPIAHTFDFRIHMICHLLLGMLAPLLFVCAAPMTLLLRTLKTTPARYVTRVLKSWPVRIFTHPVVATILNVGGLSILYTTDLYSFMHQHVLVHILVHMHVFLAGYLFTASMIYIDPTAHRFSYPFRFVVFWISLAAHEILAKYIYVHSPTGTSIEQAKIGGMVMYYGGDLIDVAIIYLLCLHWFQATRVRPSPFFAHE